MNKIKQWNGLSSDKILAGQIIKLYGKDIEPAVLTNPPSKETTSSISSVMTYHGNVKQKKIALTFDAGSDIAGHSILDVLKKHNVKATFFLTGKWVEKFPSYVRQIAEDGHEIGNHSYSHLDSLKISGSELKQEI